LRFLRRLRRFRRRFAFLAFPFFLFFLLVFFDPFLSRLPFPPFPLRLLFILPFLPRLFFILPFLLRLFFFILPFFRRFFLFLPLRLRPFRFRLRFRLRFFLVPRLAFAARFCLLCTISALENGFCCASATDTDSEGSVCCGNVSPFASKLVVATARSPGKRVMSLHPLYTTRFDRRWLATSETFRSSAAFIIIQHKHQHRRG